MPAYSVKHIKKNTYRKETRKSGTAHSGYDQNHGPLSRNKNTMKKNWIGKVAGLSLALVMITSSFVGGTFAKYVTKAEGQDNARVAKWGVIVDIEGNAFATQYETSDDAYAEDGGVYSVVACNEDQVVAPGTNSEEVGSNLVASVVGTPEVAARYTIEGKDITDVVLAAGTYTDYTELVKDATSGNYGYTKTFTLEKDYAPIKWNLVISKGNTSINVADALYAALPTNLIAAAESYGLTPSGCSFFDAIAILKKVADNDTYTQVVESALGNIVSGGRNFALEADKDAGTFKMSYDFDPNKVMDFTFELTWEWAFEQDNVELYDKADTFLGNWAAVELGQDIDGFVAPAAPSSLVIDATLVATATQID